MSPTDKPLVWVHGEVRTPRCHELRIVDENATWRIIYRTDSDAVIIADVFSKKTAQTPKRVIDTCRRRLKEYDDA